MRLSRFLPLGALALAAAELGSGDPYVDSLPFKVSKVRPKTIFASNPPIERCANGIIYMVADALGLPRQVLDELIQSLLDALGALGLDLDLGTILSRDAPRNATSEIPNFYSGLPPQDFQAAMDVMLERTYKDKVTGKPAFDSSSAFYGIWGMRSNIVSALHAIEALGANERLVKFAALGALAAKAQVQNEEDFKLVLSDLVEHLDQARCARGSEEDSDEPTAELCKLAPGSDGLDIFGGSPSDRAPIDNAVITALRGMGLELDITQLPDLLTGFATSRVVYTLIQYVLGQLMVTLQVPGKSSIDLDATGGNLGAGACRSVGISREFDFDPIWASCAMATLIGAVLGCGTTSLPQADCSQASYSVTPDWGLCDRVYGAAGLGFDPSEPIPLGLTPLDQALDGNGNLLASAIEKEGYNYYFLYAASIAAGGFTNPQSACKVPPNPLQLVPGWDRVLDVWATQEGDPAFHTASQEYFSVASLSKLGDFVVPFTSDGQPPVTPTDSPSSSEPEDASKPDRAAPGVCNFLLTQRGTSSAYEWSINFDAGMTPGYNATDPAMVHAGYKKYADAIMPEIEAFIKAEYLDTNECVPSTTTILVSGHSLGGGLAEVYAHYITNRDTFADMKIELVTFAPAHGLSQAATEALRAHANIRSVVGVYDLIPQFPCSSGGGLMRCDTRRAAILSGEGYDEEYGEHINEISLTADMMGALDVRFTDLRFLSVGLSISLSGELSVTGMNMQMPASINPGAWHVCSYACWSSAYFCTTDPGAWWMCDQCSELAGVGMAPTTPPPGASN